ncbi:hypothetical protein IE53DRAFT_303340, partial [Violaceomyces palustris]
RNHRCPYSGCGKTFAKSAHLARHSLTHSKLKNFVCPHCERPFARSDSLDRHIR